MSRESKILSVGILGAESVVHHYESFGWELLCLNGEQIAISRETKNPVYNQLVAYQSQYEAKLAEYNRLKVPKAPIKPSPFDTKTFFIRLLLFIIPGVLYFINKNKEQKEYENAMVLYDEEVVKYNAKRDALLADMLQITTESRALFFGSQE